MENTPTWEEGGFCTTADSVTELVSGADVVDTDDTDAVVAVVAAV